MAAARCRARDRDAPVWSAPTGSRVEAPERGRRRPTATCSTWTTTSPRSSTCACGIAARPVATRRRFERRRRRVRPRPLARRRPRDGPGLLVLDGVLAIQTSASATASPPSSSARATCSSRGARGRRAADRRASAWRALRPTRFALLDGGVRASACGRGRRSRTALLRRAGGARDDSTCSARSPASRGSRCGWRCCCGTWPRAGAGSSPAASACRCRSPTRCSAGSSAPSARRSRTRWRGSRRPGSSPAHGDDWHLHGSVEDQLAHARVRSSDCARRSRVPGRRASDR